MGWLKSLFNKKPKPTECEGTMFILRQGKSVPADDAFRAWTSGDLNQMLKAVESKTNPTDRHFLLQSIVGASYKLRKNDKYRQMCLEYAEKHLQEFQDIVPALKEGMGGTLPRISTFQKYVTVLTENSEYNKAISICEEALRLGLHDNTKSGFEGRIERIRKKAEKENA